MTLSRPAIEVGIAVAIAIVVLIVQPGVAVGGILALIVLAVCGAALLLQRRRPARAVSQRRRPTRRAPRRDPRTRAGRR